MFSDAVLEYLYSEEAEFTPKNEQENIKGKTDLLKLLGHHFLGTQKYAYLLDTETDKLNVYFVERNADALAGRLFHEIRFEENSDGLIKANGEHFCSPDNYNVKYEFEFKNEELSSWTVEYEVKGPRKNYTISTCYIRI